VSKCDRLARPGERQANFTQSSQDLLLIHTDQLQAYKRNSVPRHLVRVYRGDRGEGVIRWASRYARIPRPATSQPKPSVYQSSQGAFQTEPQIRCRGSPIRTNASFDYLKPDGCVLIQPSNCRPEQAQNSGLLSRTRYQRSTIESGHRHSRRHFSHDWQPAPHRDRPTSCPGLKVHSSGRQGPACNPRVRNYSYAHGPCCFPALSFAVPCFRAETPQIAACYADPGTPDKGVDTRRRKGEYIKDAVVRKEITS
jgi:hypothetical protein